MLDFSSNTLWLERHDEEFLTLTEAATRFGVSTKTIARWRKLGLESETRVIANRHRIIIRSVCLEAFVAALPLRAAKTRKLQMTKVERTEILTRAAQMAAAGRSFTETVRLLAERTGRSSETIRNILKKHDKQEPQEAIFPRYSRLLTDSERHQLLTDFRSGMKLDALCERYGRTKTTIYRVVAETRAKKILNLDLDFMTCPEIEGLKRDSDEERAILDEMPRAVKAGRKARLPSGLPSYLASLYEVPLLTFTQEQHLFRKMNYLKMRAFYARLQLNPKRPMGKLMDEIERDFAASNEVKNQLVTANLRLVVSIAKRHAGNSNNLFDLISDGNMSLIRAVEKFDYARKNRFSTYASWAIMKNYTRAATEELWLQHKFTPLENEANVEREEEVYDPVEFERTQTRQQKRVTAILKCLTPREQLIIIRRFGLDRNYPPMTLKQVGEELGVTKERIRQIEILALNKLKEKNPVIPEG